MEEQAEPQQKWWQQLKHHRVAIGVVAIILVVVIALIIAGYWFDWTGFNGYNKVTTTHIVSGKDAGTVTRTEEYQPGKGVWDWLQLLGVLAIPVVVGFGAVWFTTRQTRISEENRKQQHDTEMQIAESQQQEELLRTYFDKISDLLLDEELSTNVKIQSIVQARTLAAMHMLNTDRKTIVIRFLHDTGLLQHLKSCLDSLDLSNTDLNNIDFSGANLSSTNLSGANLFKDDLTNADLSGANLSGASLYAANLSGASLYAANLRYASLGGSIMYTVELGRTELNADLSGVTLTFADLTFADLSDADLSDADLSDADLNGVNLSGADLNGAKVTEEQLKEVMSLKGATMPDGSIHP